MTTLCQFDDAADLGQIITAVRDAEGDSLAAKFRTLLSRFDHRGDPDTQPALDGDSDPDHLGARRVTTSDHGDRAELWDDQSSPPLAPQPLHLVGKPPPKLDPPFQPADAVTSLQRRLDLLRTGGRA